MSKRIALVTGASRGIGHEIAKSLLKENYEVYGTCRHPENLSESERIPGVNFLTLDLLKSETFVDFIAQFDSLDLLVNNAGFSQIGPLEETPFEKIEEIFNGNFFAQIRLIKGFIPKLRKNQTSTILNVTSMAGIISNPYCTMYASTKAAFDRFSQGLRYELARYNIKVIVVAPLWINTSIVQYKTYDDDSPYLEDLEKINKKRNETLATAVHPRVVAKQVIGILKRKNPKAHYVVGKNRRIYAFLMNYLPQNWIEYITKKIYNISG